MKKKILLGLLILFVIIQFFRIDKTNPPVEVGQDIMSISNPNSDVSSILKKACYDCHSNETKYPWYSNVAPISWLLKSHIDEARSELNFSTWGKYSLKKQQHKLSEAYEEVEEDEMPLYGYVKMHSEANLSETEKTQLLNWFKATAGDGFEEEHDHSESEH